MCTVIKKYNSNYTHKKFTILIWLWLNPDFWNKPMITGHLLTLCCAFIWKVVILSFFLFLSHYTSTNISFAITEKYIFLFQLRTCGMTAISRYVHFLIMNNLCKLVKGKKTDWFYLFIFVTESEALIFEMICNILAESTCLKTITLYEIFSKWSFKTS